MQQGKQEGRGRMSALAERTEEVISRLEDIASELDDLAFDVLKEASEGEDPQALADGKRLAKARRAVLRAIDALGRGG